MSDADTKGPDATDPTEEDGEVSLHAAETPTAVWDEDALRAAGLDIPDESDESAPATMPAVGGQTSNTIEVASQLDPGVSNSVPPNEYRSGGRSTAPVVRPAPGLSWPATIALALVLGTVVYFLVRLIR